MNLTQIHVDWIFSVFTAVKYRRDCLWINFAQFLTTLKIYQKNHKSTLLLKIFWYNYSYRRKTK